MPLIWTKRGPLNKPSLLRLPCDLIAHLAARTNIYSTHVTGKKEEDACLSDDDDDDGLNRFFSLSRRKYCVREREKHFQLPVFLLMRRWWRLSDCQNANSLLTLKSSTFFMFFILHQPPPHTKTWTLSQSVLKIVVVVQWHQSLSVCTSVCFGVIGSHVTSIWSVEEMLCWALSLGALYFPLLVPFLEMQLPCGKSRALLFRRLILKAASIFPCVLPCKNICSVSHQRRQSSRKNIYTQIQTWKHTHISRFALYSTLDISVSVSESWLCVVIFCLVGCASAYEIVDTCHSGQQRTFALIQCALHYHLLCSWT